MMFEIILADKSHLNELTAIAQRTFLESHGHSAPESDIQDYIEDHFNFEAFEKELINPEHHYRLIVKKHKIIGYSKIVFNATVDIIADEPIAKLERIYILKSELGTGVGKTLFDSNVKIAKDAYQKGIWLFVWVENLRAFQFYKKMGFQIVGKYNFKISETHSNPNHQMYLKF